MNIKENIKIAIFSIRTNLMRALLTMLGIVIGVASVIAVITVGNGGRDYIVSMIRDMGASIINIMVNSNEATNSDYITPDDIAAIKQLDTVSAASPVTIGMGGLSTQDSKGLGMVIGCNTDIQFLLKGGCKYGRYFTQEEHDAARPVAVIDLMSANILFGRENVVGEMLEYSTNDQVTRIKIIGVTDLASTFGADTDQMMQTMTTFMPEGGMTSSMIIAPGTLISNMTGSGERYDMCYISATSEDELDAAGNAAQNILRARHNNFDREVYTVTNMATYIDLLNTVIQVFTIFIAAVSAISLLVGGIGVMNIMLVTVTERTREIGIRKALGARTRTILFQFLTESVILCLIGGLIGTALGVSGAALVSHIMAVPLSVDPWTVLIAIGFSSAIGIFFGIYPARRAAKMAPIDALRSQ